MIMQLFKNFIVFMLLASLTSKAQIIRKYSNEFLNIGVDARSMAMASAVTSHTSDVNSSYWNPSGLLSIESSELALMHASYFANIAQYDYVGYAKKIDQKSAFGVSVIRFGVDDILNTTQLIDSQGNIDYNRVSLFSVADYAATLSYAREFKYGIRYGSNAKIVRRIIGDFANSWGFGFDVGLQYDLKKWTIGTDLRTI